MKKEQKKALNQAIKAIESDRTVETVIAESLKLKDTFKVINGWLHIENPNLQRFLGDHLPRLENGERPDTDIPQITLNIMYDARVNEKHPIRFYNGKMVINSFMTYRAGIRFAKKYLNPGQTGTVYNKSEGREMGIEITRECPDFLK